MFPLRMTNLDFCVEMFILVSVAHSDRMFIVSFPISSTCLLVSPFMTKATSSAKAIGRTSSGKSLFSSASDEMFHNRGPRTEPWGHPFDISLVTVSPPLAMVTALFDKYDIKIPKMVLETPVLLRFRRISGHQRESQAPCIPYVDTRSYGSTYVD